VCVVVCERGGVLFGHATDAAAPVPANAGSWQDHPTASTSEGAVEDIRGTRQAIDLTID
jgi:hypothetical protein